ncbi:hypothetical protein COT72_00320 [archaeon CG10_big_fil_rev_8_21_14_0_10_43_11]|nr:MAG: hypothetical protein COT72_00320 [archaeon CG10_big_fil_rev_8_21_14_0_10_43_11]
MIAPCESVSKSFLPAIKAATALELVNTHRLSQMRAADNLGVTQAQISKYVAGKFSDEIKALASSEQVQNIGRELANLIANNAGEKNINQATCAFCSSFNNHDSCYFIHLKAISDAIKGGATQ